jgi:arylsulfatase A-like enzyme
MRFTPAAESSAPAARARPSVGIGMTALWIALAVGLAETAYQAYLSVVKNLITHADPQQVWTAPLSYLILFAPVVLVVHLLARGRGAEWEMRAALTCLLALAIFGPLSRQGKLHPLAMGLVALGVALQLARLATRHARVTRALVRWTVLPLLAVSVGLAALVNLIPRWNERTMLATLPAARAGAPNVLLIILDTVRAASMSLYGYARPTTPRLERLARGGVVFEGAVSPAPWTLPSHASVFTGLWPHQLSTGWRRRLSDNPRTLAEALAEHGYRTAGFVANYEYTSRESGLARGFSRWEDFRLTPYTVLNGGALGRWLFTNRTVKRAFGLHDLPGRKTAARVSSDLLAWIGAGEPERPFFAFVNLFDAHNPYLPPAPYDTLFGRATQPRNYSLEQDSLVTPAQATTERDIYDGAIAYMDAQLGEMFDSLDARGALDNTIVVVTSDHGEEFGEHGLLGHGNSLYYNSIHVPLLLVAPDLAPSGVRVADDISTRDLAATILDLAGIDDGERLPGRTLARCWDDAARGEAGPCADAVLAEVRHPPNSPEWAPVSRGDMFALLADRTHFIRDGAGDDQLFDLRQDPAERRDLSEEPAYRALVTRLDSALTTAISPR